MFIHQLFLGLGTLYCIVQMNLGWVLVAFLLSRLHDIGNLFVQYGSYKFSGMHIADFYYLM